MFLFSRKLTRIFVLRESSLRCEIEEKDDSCENDGRINVSLRMCEKVRSINDLYPEIGGKLIHLYYDSSGSKEGEEVSRYHLELYFKA